MIQNEYKLERDGKPQYTNFSNKNSDRMRTLNLCSLTSSYYYINVYYIYILKYGQAEVRDNSYTIAIVA